MGASAMHTISVRIVNVISCTLAAHIVVINI